MNKICVIGLGYIGLPTAAMFANSGYQVVGVDINERIVSILCNGGIHIHEPGLKDIVHQAIQCKSLKVASAPEPADAFIISVPTPFYPDKTADLRAVASAAGSIFPFLSTGSLVVLESTSPPRTTVDLVQPILEKSGLKGGKDFLLAYSPERVLPGRILKELVENARVIGGINPASAAAGRSLYSAFVRGEILLTDSTTAEMVKVMENTYRDVNIALANEFAHLAERFGIDIWEAVQIANLHPRVKILQPGPGVGGHCISVDPWFLVEAAPDLTTLIRTAREVNDAQPEHVLEMAADAMGGLDGRQVAVLGLAYKADVDDLRESPAVEVARLFAQAGAEVTAYEPYKPQAKFDEFSTVESFEGCVANAEAILLLVGHRQFKDLAPQTLQGLTPARLVVDTVNGWNSPEWQGSDFRLVRLGDGSQIERLLDASFDPSSKMDILLKESYR